METLLHSTDFLFVLTLPFICKSYLPLQSLFGKYIQLKKADGHGKWLTNVQLKYVNTLTVIRKSILSSRWTTVIWKKVCWDGLFGQTITFPRMT